MNQSLQLKRYVCLWSAAVAAFLCTLVTTPEADAQRGGGEVADGEVSEGWVELYEPHVHIDASLIKDVPIWAFHGDKDKVCPIERDQKLFAEMEELGGNMKYTELKDVKHNASQYAFYYEGDEPDKGYVTEYSSERCDKTANVWDWLFAQRLDKRAQEESGKKNLIDFRDSRYQHIPLSG